MTLNADPQQAAVDAAVAAMVAGRPDILTAPSETVVAQPPPAESAPVVLTPSAGLLPGRVEQARARRLAFRSAMGALRLRGQADDGPIRAAIAEADVAAIVAAVMRHSVGLFLDAECGRPYTTLHELNAELETELVAAIYAEPAAVLASVAGDELDVPYIRQTAAAASRVDEHMVNGVTGQPTKARAPSLSLLQTLVPR